ncbi:MAG: DNA-3-methyladenine glycosylase 2 family protein [Planctomycetota bacterium]
MRHRLGDPPPWSRPASFETIVHLILEQQVSLASAQATLDRLKRISSGRPRALTAKRINKISEADLRSAGVSRQKTRYIQSLASDVASDQLRIATLSSLSDDAVRDELTKCVGVGRWTADVFLIMALHRPDVFPVGDLALQKGMRELDGGDYPDAEAMWRRSKVWRGHRSMATRLIWTLYLDNRR